MSLTNVHSDQSLMDFSFSPKRKGQLKFRTDLTLSSSTNLNSSNIFDITQIHNVQSPQSSTNKFKKILSPDRKVGMKSSLPFLPSMDKERDLSNNNREIDLKSSQHFFRITSLKKMQPIERSNMDSFKRKFEESVTLDDALNFSRDSDIQYQKALTSPDLEDTDNYLAEATPTGAGASSSSTSLRKETNNNNSSNKGVFRDTQRKVMVGYLSQLRFFKHHKEMSKIQQENKYYNINDSLYTKLIKSEEKLQLLPKKLGLIKQHGQENTVSLNHYHLGDRYAQAFSKGMQSFDVRDRVRKYELGNNGLSDKGVEMILKSMSKNTEEINLSSNTFGTLSTDMIVTILRNFEYQLRKLNLDNAKLGDANGIRTLESLKKLQVLDLSNNRLTDEISFSLAEAISKRCQLQELYLHWNRLTGVTGERIAKALHDNSSIRVLDLSNNSLGLQNGDACAEAFSTLFGSEESELLHIDIGNNRWSKSQVVTIQKGININKSIYGFHLESKFASIDEDGFLGIAEDSIDTMEGSLSISTTSFHLPSIAPKSMPNSQAKRISFASIVNNDMVTPFQRINGLFPTKVTSTPQQATAASQTLNAAAAANQKICWICNGWSEQAFIWRGGESGMSYNGPIYVHMDFDGFKAIPLTKDENGNFFVRRMCPPSQRLLYFFTTPDGDTHAKDQHSVKNKQPHLKDISFGSNIKRDITIKFLNHRMIRKFEGSLFSPYYEPMHISVFPREELNYPSDEGLPKKEVWTKENSVFSKYIQDTQAILEKAMDADWNNSKIPRFVKDPVDRKKLFDLIMPHYEGIKSLYKYYSSFSPIGDVWAISKLLFIEIFTKSGLVDNRTLKLSDLEIKFISSKSSMKKQRGLVPERGLVRHEFLESMIRIAEEKYMINGDCTSYAEAVHRLMNEGFLSVISEIDSPAQWRDERYWNQECDFCYKYYMQILMTIFEVYENTIRTSLPKSKYLNLSEFKKIFTDTNIFADPHANERYINLAFNYSVQTQTDEVYDERILQLHFIEFLEAIARAAEKLSPGPSKNTMQTSSRIPGQLQLQSQTSQAQLSTKEDSKMPWEVRIEQPLHKKIENMIRFIFYNGLPAEKQDLFELHDLSIFDQKEINEAMIAPMRSKAIFKSSNFNLATETQRVTNVQKATEILRKSIKTLK